MATRPLAFGVRLRDKERTVRVHAHERDPRHYVVEVSRRGRGSQRNVHSSLGGALRELAQSWRNRLH
jgi:hypothetical protein